MTVHPYELRARSAKSLLQRLYRETAELIAEESALARVETAQRLGFAAMALRGFAGAAVCALIALGCVAACVIAALAIVMSLWLAALIVAVVFAAGAFALQRAANHPLDRALEPARSKLRVLLPPVDGQTLAEREARVDWTRSQLEQTLHALANKTDLVSPIRETALGLGSLGVAMTAMMRDGNGDQRS